MPAPGPPRRRAVLVAVAGLLLLVVGLALGRLTASDDDRSSAAAPPSPATTAPSADAPAPAAVRPPTLAVGIVTNDVGALSPPATPVPTFERAQALTDRIAPRFVRIDVRWDLIQPDEAAPFDPNRVIGDGCGREQAKPCSGPQSLTRTLAAVKAAQVAHPGHYRPLISFWGIPNWAGDVGDGCEAAKAREGAQPLAPGKEPAYKAMIAAIWGAIRTAGIEGADWTPWNEPNAPYFIDPQRAACTPEAEPRSPESFSRMVVAMDEELERLRGTTPADSPARGDRLVVGELAGWGAPSRRAVPTDEFLRALSDDVLCRADVISVHGYLEAHPRNGKGEPVAAGLRELDRRPCLDGKPAWITETAVGAPRSGGERDTARGTLQFECRLMDQQLRRWYRDPRVTAAFQYSVRTDPAFPTGLMDEGLNRTFPVAKVWEAWGGSRDPAAAPPALPSSCREQDDGAGDAAAPG